MVVLMGTRRERPRVRTTVLAGVIVCMAAGPVSVEAQQGPAAPPSETRFAGEPFFTARDAWLALGFLAGTAALAPFDRELALALQDSTLQVHRTLNGLADGLKFMGFPGSVIVGGSMYAVGRIGDMPGVAAVGLRGTEAVLLSYAVVWTGKNLAGRARPDHDPDNPLNFGFGRGFRGGTDYRSFPSGHSAAAFAAAASMTAEAHRYWPERTPYLAPALYGAATLVAASRMYHNRHWASDVVIGAAIGTFSGMKIVRYHARNPRTPLDRLLLPSAVVPTKSGFLFLWQVVPGMAHR